MAVFKVVKHMATVTELSAHRPSYGALEKLKTGDANKAMLWTRQTSIEHQPCIWRHAKQEDLRMLSIHLNANHHRQDHAQSGFIWFQCFRVRFLLRLAVLITTCWIWIQFLLRLVESLLNIGKTKEKVIDLSRSFWVESAVIIDTTEKDKMFNSSI